MKLKYGIIVFIVAIVTILCVGVLSTQVASAETVRDGIVLTFTNNGLEIAVEQIDGGYKFEYVQDMRVLIKGVLADDPNSTSGCIIRLNGEKQDAIYKAGTYDVQVNVTPSGGGSFINTTFKVVVEPKVVEARFDSGSININYGDTLNPSLVIDAWIESNSQITYEYFTDESKETSITPVNAGTYYVVATISGDYYKGSAESKLTINKADCGIIATNQYVNVVYSKEQAPDGYDILSLIGAEITNSSSEVHTLTTYVLGEDDEYYEQSKLLVPSTYQYKLFFKNGENYSADPIYGQIIIEKAGIVFDISDISLVYSVDLDATKQVLSLFNNTNGYCLINASDYSVITNISESMLNVKFYNADFDEVTPTNAGFYNLELTFDENDYYFGKSSGNINFEITQRDISSEILTYGDFSVEYGNNDYVIDTRFEIPSIYDIAPAYQFVKILEDGSVENLDEKPTTPGKYQVILVINTANLTGRKAISFQISKMEIDEKLITITNLDYTYGDALDIQVSVDDAYNISSENVTKSYYIKGGVALQNPPTFAGSYEVHVKIENELYLQTVTADLTISKKDLTITAKDRSVVYGESLFDLVDGMYQEKDFVFDGLAQDLDKGKVLAGVIVYVGNANYTHANANMVVGSYTMRIAGESTNYNIINGGGTLTITKRNLNVSVTSLTQYVSYSIQPQLVINKNDCCYNDLPENLESLFEVYFTDQEGNALTNTPTVMGNYNMIARVKADYQDCDDLQNYNTIFTKGRLTLLDNKKTGTDSQIILEGKFNPDITLNLSIIKPTDTIENAISKIDNKCDVEKLIYISDTFNTVDGTPFTIRINCAGIDMSNAKLMVGESTSVFEEVSYTVVGDYIVLKVDNLAPYYAICTPHKLPIVWIIVIAAVALVVVVAVGIFLWIYFTGANVKARKNEAQLSEAVTAQEGVKSEDDEFDELLDTFDESTVQRDEDPAERIARQQEEELREQYRLRLRRMRSVGDKSISDKLKELGGEEDFDEEKAIDQLIEEDKRKKRIQEEAERKAREEAERKRQEETTYTINERKTGTLSDTSMPITPKNTDDDDDDDDGDIDV